MVNLPIDAIALHVTFKCLYNTLRIFSYKNETMKLKNLDMVLCFAHNIDCGHTLVLTSTHDQCLEQK